MSKHTNGRLVVDGSFVCKDWRGELRPIATTHFRLPWHDDADKEREECAANARLFAGANRLLEAAREAEVIARLATPFTTSDGDKFPLLRSDRVARRLREAIAACRESDDDALTR